MTPEELAIEATRDFYEKQGVTLDQLDPDLCAKISHQTGFLAGYQAAKEEEKWISVDEKLPTVAYYFEIFDSSSQYSGESGYCSDKVLVGNIGQEPCIAEYCEFSNGTWAWMKEDESHVEASHWRPLPIPQLQQQKGTEL